MGYRVKWTKDEKEYLKSIVEGRHYIEIVELMNKKFDRVFTPGTVKAAIRRYKLNTGFTGRFPKGKKGVCTKGREKTWFKKGQVPVNHKPVGSERVNAKDGYILIKTEEPRKWELKHKVIYEKAHGKILKGYCVIFADQNKRNFDINNLILVSRAELLVMNRNKLIKDKAELTKVGVNIAKVQVKIRELR